MDRAIIVFVRVNQIKKHWILTF